MRYKDENTLTLESFEGPIDFLLHLIQKKEIDIYEISLKEITDQYLQRLQELTLLNLDSGAEFVGTTATLLWLKSKLLLPQQEEDSIDTIEEDPYFSVIHHLIDYCRFKQVAKDFSEKEQQQSLQYCRGSVPYEEKEKKLGVEHISLEDLAELLKHVLEKIPEKRQLHKEKWHISDKIKTWTEKLSRNNTIVLVEALMETSCREELIVTFLAVLELMKLNRISIIRDQETSQILVQGT